MSKVALALADTSFIIGVEQARVAAVPPADALCVSVISVAELHLGVLAAPDHARRSKRLGTLAELEQLAALPVDRDVAAAWARLRMELRDAGTRMPINDSWIAATALAHGLPVVTQDADYDVVPGLDIIRV